MKVDLTEMLGAYSFTALGAIARQLGLDLPGKKKAELVQRIAEHIVKAKTIARNLARLDVRDRKVLDRLCMCGGDTSSESLRRGLLHSGLIEQPPPDQGRNRHAGSSDRRGYCFEDVIARLTMAGLVFGSGPNDSTTSVIELYRPGRRLFIPDEVLAHLPKASALLPAPPPASPPQTREAAPGAFQRDLYLYWRFAGRNELALTARGLVPKRQLAKIVEGLVMRESVEAATGEQDLGRTHFLRRLLEELGFLQERQSRLWPAAHTPTFLDLPVPERLRRCFLCWLTSGKWNELRRVPGLVLDLDKGVPRETVPAAVLQARQFVVSLLGQLPVERWIPLAHLWERASLANYDFLLSRDRSPNDYYYHHNPYHSSANTLGCSFAGVQDDEPGWQKVEAGYITNVVGEPLHWMGLVSLGYEEDRLAALRITELGARVLRGDTPAGETESRGQVIVQPNFQIFAFDPVNEGVLARLDRFAELVRAEQAVEYQLTRQSVYRAQQQQVPVSEIIAYLEAASGRPLPQNVQRTLDEWASYHERIVVRRRVNLLHCASEELLDGLLAEKGVAEKLGRRLMPTVAVAREAPADLAQALVAAGHMPALNRSGDASCRAAITVASDGRIIFEQARPSIYLWRQLARLTEQREGDLWLTADSVRRAKEEGMAAHEFIGRLAEVHRGPLPDSLIERIFDWASHWGAVSVATLKFLRVKNAEILREMMADATVGPLLRARIPEGAIAAVHPYHMAALRAALEAKGVEVVEEDVPLG